jgi:tRNA-dihydrouridine synthase B
MKFMYMLAPLELVSDNSFRELCFNHGADLTFSEMARLDAIVRKNKSTAKRIEILNKVPTQIQFAANKEKQILKFLKSFKAPESFKGFNLNLGCPGPEVIQVGLGASLIKRIKKVDSMVKVFKDHNFSCSIKMRLGLNKYEKEKKIYLNLIKQVDADFFIVHPRHAKEDSTTTPDESVYTECVDTGKNIIANGDIGSIEKVKELKKIGIKGVMIGRGAMRNPSIFSVLKGNKATPSDKLKKEYLELMKIYPQKSKQYERKVLRYLGRKY